MKMNVRKASLAAAMGLAIASAGFAATAEEMEEIVVKGDLGSLPGERVESIFGFEKSILETPRSASTVSEEMMDRFNMADIDELVVLAPGTFTQSFFGGGITGRSWHGGRDLFPWGTSSGQPRQLPNADWCL